MDVANDRIALADIDALALSGLCAKTGCCVEMMRNARSVVQTVGRLMLMIGVGRGFEVMVEMTAQEVCVYTPSCFLPQRLCGCD